MFLCQDCIKTDKVKTTNKAYWIERFKWSPWTLSWGACESCREVGDCVDA